MAQSFVNMIQNSPFQGYKVVTLRSLAKANGICKYYKLEKLELVVALETNNKTKSEKTGDLLGEWTDELGQGKFIKKWLSNGPKS